MNKEGEVLKRSENVVATHISTGEGVLLDLATKMYYSLNPSGMQVWDSIEGCSLTLVTEISPEITAFVENLLKEGLVQIAAGVSVKQKPQLQLSEPPTLTCHEPLVNVTAFTAATAGGATFF